MERRANHTSVCATPIQRPTTVLTHRLQSIRGKQAAQDPGGREGKEKGNCYADGSFFPLANRAEGVE